MSIKTQKIEIYEDLNPIESKFVEIPVHKGEKILSHEPYSLAAMQKYSLSCTDEVMKAIATYESRSSFRDIKEGYVSSFNDNDKESTAEITLSQKHTIMVDINPNEKVNVGDKIDVVVTKSKGRLTGDASSKTAQLERTRQELIKQIETPTRAYSGIVKEVVFNISNVFNGFIVEINGVKCFMPGTESHIVPLNNYDELVGTSLYVMPINLINDSIVVSHKLFLNTLKPSVLNALMEIDKGSVVTGTISSIKHFGVFILIDNCVATLLSVSEMNEITENKFKAGQLKVGDAIDFYIDNINDDRVTITQTASKNEGWDKLKEVVSNTENYTLTGVVKNLFDNGVVVLSEEFNGITFFLSAKVVDLEKLTIGGEITLPVDSVDIVKKTVRLRIE